MYRRQDERALSDAETLSGSPSRRNSGNLLGRTHWAGTFRRELSFLSDKDAHSKGRTRGAMSLRFRSVFRALTLSLLSLVLWASSVRATYSIIACDAKTRACGVAVQTNNLAVGASVPYAQAGVGALVSQFETNPNYGPRGLALLAEGKAPEEVLKQLLA